MSTSPSSRLSSNTRALSTSPGIVHPIAEQHTLLSVCIIHIWLQSCNTSNGCNLCTLLNGEGWTRAHFSLTVLHPSVSAPCQRYICLIIIRSQAYTTSVRVARQFLWNGRKWTWGGESLVQELDSRGEPGWDLPHTTAANSLGFHSCPKINLGQRLWVGKDCHPVHSCKATSLLELQ